MNFTMYFNLTILIFFCLIWICRVAFLRSKKKSFAYLAFFTLFYIYILKVLDYTLFQFQSLLILRLFTPHLILRGQAANKTVNLIPLITLAPQDFATSLLNILLFTPFGFGLPFITSFRMKNVVIIGALFSISIEILQFVTGFLARITFRVADINDVIFNTIGVALGYILFVVFVHFWRLAFGNWKKSKSSLVRYIADRPQIGK